MLAWVCVNAVHVSPAISGEKRVGGGRRGGNANEVSAWFPYLLWLICDCRRQRRNSIAKLRIDSAHTHTHAHTRRHSHTHTHLQMWSVKYALAILGSPHSARFFRLGLCLNRNFCRIEIKFEFLCQTEMHCVISVGPAFHCCLRTPRIAHKMLIKRAMQNAMNCSVDR